MGSVDFEGGVVQGADLEEVQVVVEDVIGQLPAVDHRAGAAGVNAVAAPVALRLKPAVTVSASSVSPVGRVGGVSPIGSKRGLQRSVSRGRRVRLRAEPQLLVERDASGRSSGRRAGRPVGRPGPASQGGRVLKGVHAFEVFRGRCRPTGRRWRPRWSGTRSLLSPAGLSPVQPGGTSRKSPAAVPVAGGRRRRSCRSRRQRTAARSSGRRCPARPAAAARRSGRSGPSNTRCRC